MRRYGGPARNKDDGPLMLTKTFGLVLSFPTLFIESERHNENGNHQQNVNRPPECLGRDQAKEPQNERPGRAAELPPKYRLPKVT